MSYSYVNLPSYVVFSKRPSLLDFDTAAILVDTSIYTCRMSLAKDLTTVALGDLHRYHNPFLRAAHEPTGRHGEDPRQQTEAQLPVPIGALPLTPCA